MEICWAVDCVGGPLLACDTEAEAIETQQIAEYELGMIAIVYRPEPPLSDLEVVALNGQVVVYVPVLDHHIAFSPMEAVQLANLILAKAHEVVHG